MKFFYSLSRSIVFFLVCIITAACSYNSLQSVKADITGSGTITDKKLGEVSGIAASRINEDVLWVLNDSGNSASVYALDPDGKLISTIDIKGVSNNDWEDIASFEYDGKSYILIADVGDNFAKRSKCFLHFIEEPDISKISGPSPLSIKPSWSITYTYDDGPRDCESVAVDTVNKKILLLSKRDIPPVLYELPLTKAKNAVAKKLTEIEPLPFKNQETLEFTKNSNMPTAMDISADGLSVAVLTYGNAFYYGIKSSQDWPDVFIASPVEIIIPRMRQAEAICFNKDASSIYIASEQLPAPLYKMDVTGLISNKK